MKREALIEYIRQQYAVEPEFPWSTSPNFAVFRHTGNQKWFGLVIDISGDKLGLADNRIIEVLNVKAPVEMVGQLRQIKGIFPAYHMNKEHWISVLLDGGLDDKTILEILDDSYSLTAPRRPKSTV